MAPHTAGFFLPGDSTDPGYRNIRNLPRHHEVRQFIDLMWTKYEPMADLHFREDARNHFQQRFWEMYLAVSLTDRGLSLVRVGGEGPEFYFEHSGKRVWVEAIAPRPGTGPDRVVEPEDGVMSEIPTERILLRFTQALVDKQKKYMDSLKKGIVSDKDAYVLAINAREIPHARFGNTMPFFVQAFLPIGPLAVAIDPTTATMVESFYQYREQVKKLSGESVSTRAFLDPEFAFCSAVLHSAVDCVNRPRDFGGDFCVLHNPNATHQLDQILFSGARQLSVRGGELVENEVKS